MSDEQKYLKKESVLDHGFVELIDVLGSDDAIVNAARTSYDKGTKKTSNTSQLIRYLMRHQHNGPFEFGEFVFRVRCPIFVARQWFRHRTGSYNEVSLRYSEARDEFYVPDQNNITTQDRQNKQARTQDTVENAPIIQSDLKDDAELLFQHYNKYLEKGVAREIARINLPLSTYTSFVFKINLRNLMNFLTLRVDSHAQFEIQQYAITILKMVEEYFPITMKAWKDYNKNSITFSESELNILRSVLKDIPNIKSKVQYYLEEHQNEITISKGEITEFKEKLSKIF